ncbi:hypothetical protein Celaphus_00015072 [Cervus elaphus hippelaphus]|uniref:Uncharacterized protein n=1 Tax=Cervus elaphus hippelaphus TaxID=46360 RepID=A0A212D357_CEREH|nr:hypothetical protein Celaphus_00015072 [Cervus elaphus hippelaphus]
MKALVDRNQECTHQPCLIKWISERGCWSCELCYYKYHVIAISTKNPLQVRPPAAAARCPLPAARCGAGRASHTPELRRDEKAP